MKKSRRREETLQYKHSCFNYTIYTATKEGGPLQSTFLLAAERRGGVGRWRAEVSSLSWPNTKQNPIWIKWHFTLTKSIPSLKPQKSRLCLSLPALIEI